MMKQTTLFQFIPYTAAELSLPVSVHVIASQTNNFLLFSLTEYLMIKLLHLYSAFLTKTEGRSQ